MRETETPDSTPGLFEDPDVISRYTRAQAIEDGLLVDVTETAREAGWRFPVALTAAVVDQCVTWTEDDARKKPRVYQDERGRLWDVVSMGAFFARMPVNRRCDGFLYPLTVVPRPGYGRERKRRLKCTVGPGDTPEPVVTILLPDED